MWLVKNCPNFYSMTPLQTLEVIELEKCDESEVEYWIFDGNSTQRHIPTDGICLFRGAVECSIKAGNVAFTCKVNP